MNPHHMSEKMLRSTARSMPRTRPTVKARLKLATKRANKLPSKLRIDGRASLPVSLLGAGLGRVVDFAAQEIDLARLVRRAAGFDRAMVRRVAGVLASRGRARGRRVGFVHRWDGRAEL